MKNYVTGLMFSQDRKRLVLIAKLNPDWQRGLLNGVGGKIEAGEEAVDAMCRECAEETGVLTVPAQWMQFAVIRHRDQYNVHFFVLFDDAALTARTLEKELVGVYDVDALPSNLLPNLRWLIPLGLDRNMCFDTPVLLQEAFVPQASMLIGADGS